MSLKLPTLRLPRRSRRVWRYAWRFSFYFSGAPREVRRLPELLIRNARIMDPFGGCGGTMDVLISRGRIAAVARELQVEGRETIEAQGMVLAPGFLEIHAHLREPGGEDAETLASGLEAALRGGYTAVCCMPNTRPPLDNAAVVEGVAAKARDLALADLFPVGCISRGREGRELAEMALMHASEARVRAFSDDGSGIGDSGLMRMAMEYVQVFDGLIISHAEEQSLSRGGQVNEGTVSTEMGLRGIPALAEEVMVARDILLAEETGCRLHLAHLSTERSLRMLREAKKRGVRVTAEATPHHLLLSEMDISGYDTVFKVNPPLRTLNDVKALREALHDGTIDAIATDHAPHTVEDKEVEFDYAPFGMVGMESSFPVLYSELVLAGELELMRLIEMLTSGPARVMGMQPPEYGAGIVEGARADLVLLDLENEWTLDARRFASKGRNCPFHGRRVKGRIRCTLKNGKMAYQLAEAESA
ncbi:MAG: dihydroorotase [Actinobacteria bacterium]|nr:dihydroorotase [Actinomycetota bacterium]